MRAEFIAKNWLTDVKLVNQVRNIYAFTGKYQGKEVTVMASGMGMPSIGIYSYELFTQLWGGADRPYQFRGRIYGRLKLYDVVLAERNAGASPALGRPRTAMRQMSNIRIQTLTR
ncbi:hypothetical protein [Enterocloster sp.]|uniref:hypothetical protein n=1 Tax=Enterocloster sp. TaxID=2719315 RepID=UPI0039A1A0FB